MATTSCAGLSPAATLLYGPTVAVPDQLGTAACLWAVKGVTRQELEGRLATLRRVYAPLDPGPAISASAGPGTWLGVLPLRGVDGHRPRPDLTGDELRWGSALVAKHELFSGCGVLARCDDHQVTLTTGTDGPQALFRCGDAIATQAAAAAVLAGRRPRLRAAALGPLVRTGWLGLGPESHLEGVACVAPATRVTLGEDGVRERALQTDAERWALIPEADAQAAATTALHESAARLGDQPDAWLGLTDGLDSRVLAVALRHAGAQTSAFTWTQPGLEEPGTPALAARLGLPHTALPWKTPLTPDAVHLSLAREALWTEGVARLAPGGAPPLPPGARLLLTGAGGETGRAFLYRWASFATDTPSPRRLVAVLTGDDRALKGWASEQVERALALAPGWRALDVLYADGRVRQWGRGMLPRAAAPLLSPLADQAVAAALASLPLHARQRDGFHRAYLAEHGADLGPLPPLPPAPREGVPGPLRDLAAAARGARVRVGGQRPEAPGFGSSLDETTRAWLQTVATHPLTAEALGSRRAEQLRAAARYPPEADLQLLQRAGALIAFADQL